MSHLVQNHTKRYQGLTESVGGSTRHACDMKEHPMNVAWQPSAARLNSDQVDPGG
jgi:hypothetical protein